MAVSAGTSSLQHTIEQMLDQNIAVIEEKYLNRHMYGALETEVDQFRDRVAVITESRSAVNLQLKPSRPGLPRKQKTPPSYDEIVQCEKEKGTRRV